MKAALALLFCLAPALRAAEARRFAWDGGWPRFRTSEYVVTGLALAGSAGVFFLVPPSRSAVWRGENPFDRAASKALVIPSETGRGGADDLGDILSFPLIGYSMLDGPITAAWNGGNRDTAFQLALINAETFAVTEVLNLTVSIALPRERPEGAGCPPDSKYDPHCTRSFWSGHAANVFAAASLICAEHGALRLYGGKADAATCGAALATASAAGLMRIAGNHHHASDVIVGAAVGAATGYLMPNLLHFKPRGPPKPRGYWLPRLGPHGGGLTYVRRWG